MVNMVSKGNTDSHFWLTLPADARSPRRARDFVISKLEYWGVSGVDNEARLLTSELVTNAVLHARTELTVSIDRDLARGVIRVSVADGSEAPPARRRFSALATTGRGLAMVSEGAQAFGVEQFKGGKSVWFELVLPPVEGATA